MFVFSRNTFNVLNVWYLIHDHGSSCVCLPEIHTMSLMLNISSMIIVLLFVSSRDIHTVSLMFDISSVWVIVNVFVFQSSIPCPSVRHIIHDLCSSCFCLPDLNIVSLLFDVWSMINWSSMFMFVIFRLCLTEFNSVSLLFYISLMIIVVYVCVFQR